VTGGCFACSSAAALAACSAPPQNGPTAVSSSASLVPRSDQRLRQSRRARDSCACGYQRPRRAAACAPAHHYRNLSLAGPALLPRLGGATSVNCVIHWGFIPAEARYALWRL